ncbi:hypothetical protein [Arthrobacter sp. NPDC056727]|uniref:hypothetical protein n=1 Tax=Arthrobacter sp. NPDC056727 TaxID=3345927 RepID=UPI0036715005
MRTRTQKPAKQRRDKSWAIFTRELNNWMDHRQVGPADLVERLQELGLHDVHLGKVKNWRNGTGCLLAELPYFVRALEMGGKGDGSFNPNYLAEKMGIIPETPSREDVVDLAYRVQKLELKYHGALERASEAANFAGAAGIVSAAVQSRNWAVAVWPAVEGPEECRLHVSDRIDIRPNVYEIDPEITPQVVWEDPVMRDALRVAYAIPAGRKPRWSYHEPGVTSWSISHIGKPMAPTIRAEHPGFSTINFYSQTVDSWVNDVASLTATVLGYGLTTTRDLAMEYYGIFGDQILGEHREPMHRWLLDRPLRRRVSSHYGPISNKGPTPFANSADEFNGHTFHVWLQEDESLLQEWFDFAPREPHITVSGMLDDQKFLTEKVRTMGLGDALITLPVHNMKKENTEGRWMQVLETVLSVVNHLEEHHMLSHDFAAAQRLMLQARPNIAGPLYRWLKANGCLAVQVPT